jgi:2-polyprenyl-6-hydroxyphenyl methylase/3-demethylubiquinone-9 3-methyltransferase
MNPSHIISNYDPHNSSFDLFPNKKFDIIFSSEVFEHCVNLNTLSKELSKLLHEDGLIIFSTMLQPKNLSEIKCSWWYISPRNGHISIYSQKSLKTLALYTKK